MINPTAALQGEAVTVSTRVSNNGESDGDYEVVLKVNGIVERTKTVTIKAGNSETVTFTISRDNPGDYEIEINGNKAVYTVQKAHPATTTPVYLGPPPAKRGPSWLLIGLLIVGGLVIGVGVVMFINRGRK
jgi:uncharacterized protein YfaS (alpha-2-macroglobulin family)